MGEVSFAERARGSASASVPIGELRSAHISGVCDDGDPSASTDHGNSLVFDGEPTAAPVLADLNLGEEWERSFRNFVDQ